MNSKRNAKQHFGFRQYLSSFSFALGSAFWGAWIPILTNWVSQIAGNWLQIETGPGTWLVIALSIATLLGFLFYMSLSRLLAGVPPNEESVGSLEIQTLLQGSIFSLAITLSLICKGFFDGGITFTKLLQFGLVFLPMVQSLAGKRTIVKRVADFRETLTGFIESQLRQSPNLVTQRMIENKIREFENSTASSQSTLSRIFRFSNDEIERFGLKPKLLPPDKVKSLARSIMKEHLEDMESSKRRIVLDTFREPENWKLLIPNAT